MKILILEDVPNDAELIEHELKNLKIPFSTHVSNDENSFVHELNTFQPDLILADYFLPTFTGRDALRLVRRQFPAISFIVVTGSYGEEKAVECIKAGADDYIIKKHLPRLTWSIEIVLLKKENEQKLRASEHYNRMLSNESPIGLALCRMDGKLVDVNPAFAKIIGRTVEETLSLSCWDITPQRYVAQEAEQLKSLEETGAYGPYKKEYIHKDGHLVPVRLQGLIIKRDGEKFIWSSVEDISERQRAKAHRTLRKQHKIF